MQRFLHSPNALEIGRDKLAKKPFKPLREDLLTASANCCRNAIQPEVSSGLPATSLGGN